MNIEIAKPTSKGVDASCWRFMSYQIVLGAPGQAVVWMSGFYDKARMESGAEALDTVNFTISGVPENPTAEQIFEIISNLPEWKENSSEDTS